MYVPIRTNFVQKQTMLYFLFAYPHPVGDGMSESDPHAFPEVMVTSEKVIAEEARALRLIDHT